jgi:protein angel
VCYKPTRFRLLCASPVEYFRPGLELLNRDNVGLVLLLQPLVPEGLGQVSVAPLCVANTHVLYNPRRGDVKLAQMAILLAEVDKVARLSDGSHCPIILCGDLNSVPDSPLYNFIRDGELQYNGMPAWKVKWDSRRGVEARARERAGCVASAAAAAWLCLLLAISST